MNDGESRDVYVWSLEKHGLRMAIAAILVYLRCRMVEEWKAGEGTTFKVVPRDG
jgi:hypothetical protein